MEDNEILKTISEDDMDAVVSNEKDFLAKGYETYCFQMRITKAQKEDLLKAIKTLVDSDSFSHRRYEKIESIEYLETRIDININWVRHILFVSLIDSSEGTLILSELFSKYEVQNTSICRNIIADSLKELNLDDELKIVKTESRIDNIISVIIYIIVIFIPIIILGYIFGPILFGH